MSGTLGERELDIMGVLWRHGPGTVAEVQGRLSDELAYNTVLTILRNLEAKGFVGHTANGRLFSYHTVVAEQTVRKNALTRLTDKLFGGSAVEVIAHLVEREKLSRSDMRNLHELLETRIADAGKQGGAGKKSAPRTKKRGKSE